MKEAKEGLRKAHKFRRKVKKRDALFRIEHLTNLVMEKEQHGDKSSAIYLRELKHIEQTLKKHRHIKFVEKKFEKTLTTFVTKTLDDGTILELTDKDALEQEIINKNLQKYHQTEDSCQLFDDPICQEIVHLRDGPAREQILDRTYTVPADTSQATTDFQQYMRKS